MKILAFEASTRRLSVALWNEGELVERSDELPNGGSQWLLPWAGELLAAAGLGFTQLDGIAFGAGPGSFTGLRLACGVAQGLACGLNRPVVAVGTLVALALSHGEGRVLTCLDARMHELYVAAYHVRGDTVEEVLEPKVGSGKTVPLPEGDGWYGVGDGFAIAGDLLRQRMGIRLLGDDATRYPSATAVARLAAPRLARGEGIDAAEAVLLYVRNKVALTTAERLARGGTK